MKKKLCLFPYISIRFSRIFREKGKTIPRKTPCCSEDFKISPAGREHLILKKKYTLKKERLY